MWRLLIAGLGFACCLVAARGADLATCMGCTGPMAGGGCVPDCKATWEEKKSSRPEYALQCEYACARARDSWHAPDPECRCHPPAGAVYVKKRLYKTDGEPKIERVPKYEARMVPTEPCGCGACPGGPAAPRDPLGLSSLFGLR